MTRRGQKQLTAGDNATPGQLQQMEIEGFMNLIREAAANPAVDPEKLDKLLSLRERVMDRSAEQQFHDAMHRAQERMKFVATDKKNPDKGNRYASFKALDREIRPIYSSEGFSVSYDTGMGKVEYGPIPDGSIRILMDIAHSAGHKIQKHVDIPVETTGAQGTKMMTKIHATGSAMSYGKRYLLIFGFNLAVGEEDDDGNKAGGEKARGGDDHKYKNAQSKSDRKAAKSEPKEGDPDWQPGDRGRQETRNKYPTIKRADKDADRVAPSSLKTMEGTLKRYKIPEKRFDNDFGFPLAEVDKRSLNEVLDWMKEVYENA
jgi:hypothetical protein